LKEFFSETSFGGKCWLDLGPGQFDFGELAGMKGAIAHGLDNDEAVIKLGEYKKFKTVSRSLKNIADLSMGESSYVGLFCKFSINAFWFVGNQGLAISHVEDLCSLLKPNGSAWIAPWNGVPKMEI
jgi:hypothetical protein